ncbi:SusC/RagA family TonB-linked outer membrane protein [Leeuwenhoekiella marinoflava]|uniref:TonB-linked SusC/RagA family outer membrane protein n=2 Tax=Leeuwenhoekiella marinoflava TaxID=988 RepID=A0A4Q0PF28_9FLAO|nr:TonB-dependent receptor [Leeuwenhoekiella marinoflava]RXG25401.1 TonB-linked SusC/RagA family outer membrane protein [Leeuwenhoekiella marinoflava]SHF88077.1 TonB-linked outer membrane protein, SusC/RagA family [Leeuwenhoekiella marinoflava DSM 3653]
MKQLNKRILLFLGSLLLSTAVWAQEKTVTGTVTDPQGMPLPGVNVLVKGTTSGTQTDFDGNFNVQASEGDILLFSYVGMKSISQTITSAETYMVAMEEDSAVLDEVVLVGYGTQKKSSITTAVATMDTDILNQRPISKVDQAMVGQMAGVRVKQTSGVPGKSFSVQVRGTGSISAGNQPLYVIDGFPLEPATQNGNGDFGSGNPLDNINPGDIESIQVLKDAAAASIYGSRASNGVVLITTKSGKLGKPKLSFNTYYGINQTVKKLDVLSAEEWVDRATEIIDARWVNSGTGRTANQTSAERQAILGGFDTNFIKDDRWSQQGHPGLDYMDWQDEFFRTGEVKSYQLSARGGNEFVNYFISGEHLDQDGIALGVNYKRYSARANVEITANEKLKFGINIAPSYSVTQDPGVEGKDNLMHYVVSATPISENGLDYNVGDNNPYAWGRSVPSPIRTIENTIGENKIFRTLTTLYGEYEIIEGLRVKSSINLDNTEAKNKYFKPSFVDRNRQASGSFSSYQKQNFVNENTVNYDLDFNDIHTLSLLGGASYSIFKFDNQRILAAEGFGSDDITTINAANNISASGTYTLESKKVLISYFGRAQYGYKDTYLLTASIRRDGSSNFGRDTKWGVFPSASLGWNIDKEKFISDVNFISNMKLRASWGLAGNNTFSDDYASISRIGFSNYSYNGNFATGQVPINSANPNLSWEESETINFGTDIGLFKGRIFTSFDYYVKTNKDLLLSVPVPTASGFSSAVTNIGKVENRGWEFELTTRNLQGGEFTWTTNFNLSHNTNEVKQLGPDNSPILGGDFDIEHNILQVGQPLYSLFLVQQDGILSAEDIANGAALYGNQMEGDPKYVDANGDGVISPADRVLSGQPNPDYVYGITNTFTYKGFDLTVLLQGQSGGKIYSTFGRAIDRTGQGYQDNHLGFIRDRWRSPENPGNGIEGKAYSTFGRIKNTDWLYSSDYWRIRNITLGYDLGAIINTNIFSGLRIYITAENWFGNDKYYGGFNPEAVNSSGDDYGAFPLSKSIVTGLNFTF